MIVPTWLGLDSVYGKFNDSGHISENSTRNGSKPVTTEQHEKGGLKCLGCSEVMLCLHYFSRRERIHVEKRMCLSDHNVNI